MKKIIITFAVMLLASSAFAQFSIGPKVGLNFSQFSTNRSELKANMQPGFDLGVFARIGTKLYVQPELMYSFSSTKLKTIGNEIGNFSFRTSSLDMPILLGYKLLDLGVGNIRAFIGPEFSFVVGDDISSTVTETASSFNFGGQAGVGFDVLMLSFDFRFRYSFTNAVDSASDLDLRNNAFIISIGWKLL